MKKLTVGEFYCGPGGLGLGAKLARIKNKKGEEFSFKHVFATDYDQDSCDTFKKNMPEIEDVICTDIRDLNIEDLPYVDGISFDILVRDINNETYLLLAFEKVYSLLAIKQKKNRRFDLNEVKLVGLHLLDGVNEWNA